MARSAGRDVPAAVLAVAAFVGGTFALLRVHPAWVDALPGTGAGYAVAVLVVAHLPGLALGLALGSLGPGRPPMWWQVLAAVTAFWYFTLLVTTVDLRNGGMGPLESRLAYDRFEPAASAARAAAVGALLCAFVVDAARRRARWLLAVPVCVVAPFLLLARDVLVG